MRRAANPTRKISITIQDSTFNELNRVLSYTQSRSAFIDAAIVAKLSLGHAATVAESTVIQLKVALHSRICGCYEQASCPTMILLRKLKMDSSLLS